MQKISIENLKEGSPFTKISVDGHKVEGVRSYKLEQKCGNSAPTLTLELNALNVSVDGEVLLWSKEMNQEMEITFKEPAEADPKN